jgi:hypothetical protein
MNQDQLIDKMVQSPQPSPLCPTKAFLLHQCVLFLSVVIFETLFGKSMWCFQFGFHWKDLFLLPAFLTAQLGLWHSYQMILPEKNDRIETLWIYRVLIAGVLLAIAFILFNSHFVASTCHKQGWCGYSCTWPLIAATLSSTLFGLLILRWQKPLRIRVAASLLTASNLGITGLIHELFCDKRDLQHLLTTHIAPLFLVLLIGIALGNRLIRSKNP